MIIIIVIGLYLFVFFCAVCPCMLSSQISQMEERMRKEE